MIYLGQDPVGISAGGLINDVRVNGESVVENGVANVPKASNSSLGVMSAGGGLFATSTGSVVINKAPLSHIKQGTETYNTIVPSNQHESTFYGLAKAAGADMASSSNPVGTYTDAAQGAIQKMLGIPGNSDIAYIEMGVVAQRAYKPGEYFVDSDGILSKAMDTIASGGSLVLDTNYEHVGGQGGLANDLAAPAELVGSVTLTGDDVPTGGTVISIPLSKPCKHLTVYITNGNEYLPAWSYLRLNYRESAPCVQVRSSSNHKSALCIIDLVNKYAFTLLKGTANAYSEALGGAFEVSQWIINTNVAKEVGFSASSGYAEGFKIDIFGR